MTKVDLVFSSHRQVDSVRLDRLTRELAADLRREARIVVDVAPGAAARSGAKSGAGLEVGRLVLAGVFSATTVQALASVLKIWIKKRKDSVFRLSRGDVELVVEGTGAEVDAALARLPEILGTTDSGAG